MNSNFVGNAEMQLEEKISKIVKNTSNNNNFTYEITYYYCCSRAFAVIA